MQCGRNNNFSMQRRRAKESLGKKHIRIPVRKIKQVSGIKMNNFCVCLGTEIAVKNFARVPRSFLKIYMNFNDLKDGFVRKLKYS